MSIFSKFSKRAKISIDKIYQWPSLANIFNSTSNSGVSVNEWKSLQLSVVYACIRLISNSIAMLPLQLHQTLGENSSIASNKVLNNILYRLPNRYITAFLFKQTLQAHVLMYGNAFAEKVINGAGEVIELWPLAPWNMSIEVMNGEKKYIYKLDNKEITYKENEIFHICGLSFDGLQGYSPIQVMKNEIGLGLALQEFGSKYFANGANTGGVLEHPGRLGTKARQNLTESIENNYTGASNSFRLLILEEGLKYNKVGIPADDAQFIQSRTFQISEICRYFGVQPHMIQELTRSTFNNIEQQSIEFKTYCLGPWINIWEQEIYKSLLTTAEQKQGYYAKFNMNALLRGDFKSRIESYRTGIQMGLYSLDEVRQLEDMNPIGEEAGGNIHFVNSAMIPIENQMQLLNNQNSDQVNEDNNIIDGGSMDDGEGN